MSYNRLRNVTKFCISIGFGFLAVGITLFMSSTAGTQPEKIGMVLMVYSAIFLGIGFTALIAVKSP